METDLQRGGGYTYQWECAILLALNYFFEPVRYSPDLFDLISDFLGEVSEIHLEGKDQAIEVDLEDITLINDNRRILVQVKTKQSEGKRWTPTDPLLLKALGQFYDCSLPTEEKDDVRFVFLTNRPLNPSLIAIKQASQEGALDRCPEAAKLLAYLERERGMSLDVARFQRMLTRMTMVKYLDVDTVKANVQAKLQAAGRRDWQEAHARLFEHFARRSTRVGGGIVTRASIADTLGLDAANIPSASGPSIASQGMTDDRLSKAILRGGMSLIDVMVLVLATFFLFMTIRSVFFEGTVDVIHKLEQIPELQDLVSQMLRSISADKVAEIILFLPALFLGLSVMSIVEGLLKKVLWIASVDL
ncbi:MAG: hypothetical protein JXA14_21220 [Anaerolineae bacterium]|nr:hypothetical protein [Anaerolineae bacterium]